MPKLIFVLGLLFTSPSTFATTNPVLEAGIDAYQQSKYDEAKAAFLQLVGKNQWTFAALYNLGNVAVRQKHLGEALGYYERALKKNPRDADARYNFQFVEEA